MFCTVCPEKTCVKFVLDCIQITVKMQPQRREWDIDEMRSYDTTGELGKACLNLPGLHQAALTVERMLNQNLFDDITQGIVIYVMGWILTQYFRNISPYSNE